VFVSRIPAGSAVFAVASLARNPNPVYFLNRLIH
jgi:hypothetical protein